MPVQTNITTFMEGTSPQLIKMGQDSFQCPLCLREGPYHALIPHLQGHQKTAVKYKEYNIYKCNLDCVPSSHYHCCFCPKVLVRRDQFYIHLKCCPLAGPEVAATAAPPLTPAPPKGPPRTPTVPKGPPMTLALISGPPLTLALISGPPLTPAAPKGPPLTPAAPKGPLLTPAVPKEPPLTPVVISGPPLTLALIIGPTLTPGVPKGPPLTPAVPKGPPLTPAVPKGPPLTPAVPKGPPLTPVVPKEPPLTPVVSKGPPLTQAVSKGHQLTQAVSKGPPLTLTLPSGPPLTPAAAVTAPKILLSKFSNTTCCICKLRLKKKNLKIHIQRKHSPSTRDITVHHHLQSLCVDRKSRRVHLCLEPHPQASQGTPNSHEKPHSREKAGCRNYERQETTISIQTKMTAFMEGTSPQLIKMGQDSFQCPLCLREGPYHALIPHLQGHQKTVVKYKEYNIYKCHLDCVPSSHFHCCFCPKVLVRRDQFYIHLKSCPLAGPKVSATAASPLTPEVPKGPPLTPALISQPPLTPAVPKGPPRTPALISGPSLIPAVTAPKILPNTTCCISNLALKKKKPQLVKIGQDSFQCPLCLKEGPYHALIPHLQGHQKTVVKYKEYNLYKCHLDCVPSSHYHCCFCPKVLVRRDRFYIHLKACPMASLEVAATAAPPLLPAAPSGPPLTPAVPSGPPPTPTAPSCPTSKAVARSPIPAGSPLTAAAALMAPKILLSKFPNTTCLICNLVLKKKNLKTHIQRKHSPRTRDITANHHLQSLCVDRKRGIFAVLSSFMGPVYYIHVQKCIGGKKPQTICQLDECNKVSEFTGKTWQVSFNCQHVKSLVYSPVATHLTVALDENVLTDLTISGWLSEDTERDCLRRKLAADADGAPLTVEVNPTKDEQRRYFFSVFEPKISSYCKFGRVIVYYNVDKNTWHCPCKKAQKSCAHKAIAMWHLHQLKPDMLTKRETSHEDFPEIYLYLSS